MECRINFEIGNEDEFDAEASASHLPGETWKLFDDDDNFIKAFRGNSNAEAQQDNLVEESEIGDTTILPTPAENNQTLDKNIFTCDDGYHPKEEVILVSDVKHFIKLCIDSFYGNDVFKDEIRTPIEARDILLRNAGKTFTRTVDDIKNDVVGGLDE